MCVVRLCVCVCGGSGCCDSNDNDTHIILHYTTSPLHYTTTTLHHHYTTPHYRYIDEQEVLVHDRLELWATYRSTYRSIISMYVCLPLEILVGVTGYLQLLRLPKLLSVLLLSDSIQQVSV